MQCEMRKCNANQTETHQVLNRNWTATFLWPLPYSSCIIKYVHAVQLLSSPWLDVGKHLFLDVRISMDICVCLWQTVVCAFCVCLWQTVVCIHYSSSSPGLHQVHGVSYSLFKGGRQVGMCGCGSIGTVCLKRLGPRVLYSLGEGALFSTRNLVGLITSRLIVGCVP